MTAVVEKTKAPTPRGWSYSSAREGGQRVVCEVGVGVEEAPEQETMGVRLQACGGCVENRLLGARAG